MPALQAAATLPATADMNVELPMDRLAGDLHLVLLIDVGLIDRTAAIGADIGQRSFVDFVNPLGRRTMRLGSVILAWLAPGLLRRGLGRAFGKGRRLAFAGALLLLEQAGQSRDVGFQFGDPALQGLAAGANDFVHAPRIA